MGDRRTRAVRSAERDAFMKVICIAPNGRSGYASQSAVAVGCAVGRRSGRAGGAEGGRPAASRWSSLPGEYPVVFEPQAVGWLLDLLGETAFNGLAYAEGRGALVGRLGESDHRARDQPVRLAHERADTSALVRRRGDPEGAAAADPGRGRARGGPRRPQRGAGRHGQHRAMRSPRAETRAAPTPQTSCSAGGGARDEGELCSQVERGIYVTRLWYANVVRPKETLITAVTRDGTFLIEDGKVTRPLRDLRLTDSVLGILSRTQALTREQKLTSDGEFYGRRFAYGVVCPALRADAVRFTGAAG